MNETHKIIAAIIYLCLSYSATDAWAQEPNLWVSNGPEGGTVLSIAID
jgi:hypothetical protein